MPKSPVTRRYLLLFIGLLLTAGLIYAGCGGGGGAATNNSVATDTSPVVSTVSGYVYVALTAAAPASSPAPSRQSIPAGFTPLSNAVVQLSGTTLATLTNNAGYFSIPVTQNQLLNPGLRTITVLNPDTNVSIAFDVNIRSGYNPSVQVELNTNTGSLNIKELNSSGATDTFVWISGKVTSNTGSLYNATVTATLASNPAVSKTAATDTNGFYTITGLSDGIWNIKITKADYNSAESTVVLSSLYSLTNVNFKVSGTFVISNVLATKFTGSTSTIEWSSSVPATSQVEYGTTPAFGQVSALSNILVQTHSVLLQNLSLNTTYHFRVRCVDQNNNSVYSNSFQFTTTDGTTQDTDPPVINTWDFTKSHNSFTVVYTMNKSAYGRLEYGTSRQSLTPTTLQGPSTTITIEVFDLTPNTSYYVDLVGINITDSAITARQAIGPIVTDAEPDLTAPVVSAVSVSDLLPTSFTISWTTNEKSNSQIYYDLVAGSNAKEVTSYNPLSALQDVAPQVTFHQVKLTNLQIDKTYYLRPVSRDSSGNTGKSDSEVVVRTPKPNTSVTIATTTENPAAGSFAVGEDFDIFRIKMTGSDTEAVDISKLIFTRSGTAVSSDFETIVLKHESSTGTVTYPGTLLASTVTFDTSTTKIEIPQSGETFMDLAVRMKSASLGKTATFSLAKAADITSIGKTFALTNDWGNAFPVSGNTQTVQKGTLLIEAGDSATAETTLNKNLSNVTFLEFKLTAQYEDIYLQAVQAEQFGSATTGEYNNVTMYYGIQPLASAPGSNTTQSFTSTTVQGLMTIPKDTTRVLKIVANVPPSATEGRVIQFRLDPTALGGLGASSGLSPATSGSMVNGSRYTLGESSINVTSSFLSPTAQIFVPGDVSKDLFAFTVSAGGAEDMRVTSVKLTQNGTALAGDVTNFHLVVDNLTVGSTPFDSPDITFSNASGLFLIPQSGSKTVKVLGDIAAVSGRTIQLSIKAQGDVQGTGTTSNSNYTSTGTSSGDSHVVTGKLQAQADAGTPSGTIVIGSQNSNLFSFQLVSTGEDVRVRTVYVKVNGDSRLVSGLTLTDGTTSWTDPELTSKGWSFNVNETSILTNAVAKTFTVSGDLTSNADFNGTSFNASLDSSGVIGVGASSNVVFNSRGALTGNSLTLTMGSLALVKNSTVAIPAAVTAGTAGAQNLFAFDLTAGSGENISVSSIIVQGVQGVSSSSYGSSGNVDAITLTSGATTVNAVNSGSLFTFTFSPVLSITAGATASFTMAGTIPQSAVRGTILQFSQASTKVSASGATSGLTLATTGSAIGDAIALQAATVQVKQNAGNPAPTDYPSNTVGDIELLRFDVVAGSEENVTLTKANFVSSSTTVLDPTTFKLAHYVSGVASGTEYAGAAVTVDGSLIQVDLTGTVITVTAGSSTNSFRFLAQFKSGVQNGGTAKIDMSTTQPLISAGVVSGKTVTASGIVTGNTMRVIGTTDTTAPVISAVSSGTPTTTGATITWTTDEPSSTLIYYRKTADSSYTATAEYDASSRTTAHSITLSGLTYNTAYTYYVSSADAAGNRTDTSASPSTFTTANQVSGTIVMSLHAENPGATSHPAKTALDYLKFTLTAANENSNVNSVIFTIANGGGAGTAAATGDFEYIQLTDGVNTWNPSYSGATITFATTSPQLSVTTSTPVNLTLKGKTLSTAGGKEAIFTLADGIAGLTAKGGITSSAITATGGPLASNLAKFVQGSIALAQFAAPSASLIPHKLGDSNVTLLSFTLTTDANEAIKIERVAINQTQDASLVNDLFNLRLVENSTGTVVTSAAVDGVTATFGQSGSTLITLPVSTAAKRYDIVGDISTGATAGKLVTLTISEAGIEAKGSSTGITLTSAAVTVTGSPFIIGNATLTTVVSSTSPVSTVFQPSQTTGSTLARFDVQAGSTEDITTTLISVKYTGTAVANPATPPVSLQNIKLYDGTSNHTLTYAGGSFTTSDAIVLTRNTTTTFTILGDIVGSDNGGHNLQFSLLPGAVTGNGATLPVTSYSSTGTATAAQHFIIGDVTVSSHPTITMPVQSSADFITGNSTALTFFTGSFTSNNENTNINQVKVGYTGNSSDLTDVKLIATKGNYTYTNPTLVSGQFVFNTQTPNQLVVYKYANPPDTSENFILQAKISPDAAANSTVAFNLNASDVTAIGASSSKSLVVSGNLAGNTITLKKGSLTVATDPATPTTTEILLGGTTKLEAWFRLTASSVEDFTLRKVKVVEEGSAIDGTDISSVGLYIDSGASAFGGTTIKSLSNHVYTFSNIQTSAGLEVKIPKGTSRILKVKATAPVTATDGKSIRFRIDAGAIEGRGAISAVSLASTTNNIISTGTGGGTNQTLRKGKLYATSNLDSSPHAAYTNFIEVGSTGVVLMRFNVSANDGTTASLEDITVKTIKLRLSGTVEYFNAFHLYDGAGNLLKSVSPSTSDLIYENLSRAIPAGSTEIFTIRTDIKSTAPSSSSASLSILNAGDITGTGTTTGASINSTGSASWYTFITQKTSLSVSNPAVQVGATPKVPGTQFKAFEFNVTAGQYEGFKAPSFKLTKSGTITDANLYAALYEGTTKLVDYTVFSGSTVTLTAPVTQTLSAGQTKTYSIYAYPQLATANNDTFSLSIASDGDCSATGVNSGTTTTSTGLVSGSTFTMQRSGVILSLHNSSPAGSTLKTGQTVELLRFTITTDGKQIAPAVLKELKLTSLGNGLLGQDFGDLKLYDSNNNFLADQLAGTAEIEWQYLGSGVFEDKALPLTEIVIAPASTVASRTFYVVGTVSAANNTTAGSTIQVQAKVADVVINGPTALQVQGDATSNTFTVKPATLTIVHHDLAVQRGWDGAPGIYKTFLVGNTRPKDDNGGGPGSGPGGTYPTAYVLAVFQITNDSQEAVDINKITFQNVGSARYGTDFSNLKLWKLGKTTDLAGAQGLTADDGTLNSAHAEVFELTGTDGALTTQGNPADYFTFTLDDDFNPDSPAPYNTDTDKIDDQTAVAAPLDDGDLDVRLLPGKVLQVAITGTFPVTGDLGRSIKFRISTTSLDALGVASKTHEPANNQILAAGNSDSVQDDITKTLLILTSPNNPATFKCQVPPVSPPAPAADDLHPYTVFKFKLKNNDTASANITYGEILYTGTLPYTDMEKSSEVDVGTLYTSSYIQLKIPGHPTADNQLVRRTYIDTSGPNPKLIWKLDDTDQSSLIQYEDDPFTINPDTEIECELIIFLERGASDVKSIKFNVLESTWLGTQSAGNEELLYSAGGTTSNTHETDDVIKLNAGGGAFGGDTLQVFLSPGTPGVSVGSLNTGVLRFKVLNSGTEEFELLAVKVDYKTVQGNEAVVAPSNAVGDLDEVAILYIIDEDTGAYSGNYLATFSSNSWTFMIPAAAVKIAVNANKLFEVAVVRHELCFDPNDFDEAVEPPAWWPANWPAYASAGVNTGTLVTQFGSAWTEDNYTVDWPSDTIVVVLAPDPTRSFSLAIADDSLAGGYVKDGVNYWLKSDNTVTGTSYSLSTQEVITQ